MDFVDFKTGENDCGRRLDKVIRIFLPESPLSQIYKSLRKGLIKVNNKKIKEDYKISNGDIINIASFLIENQDKTESSKKNLSSKLPAIVFENEHLLILDKPYNTLVHGDENSLDKIVVDYYNSKNHSHSLSFKPGPLHRIDKKTTGLICFSQSLQGAQWFSKNLQDHNIQKKYYGIIEGHLENKEIWEDFISKESDSKKEFHTVKANFIEEEDSKAAYTEVIPLSYGKYNKINFTLVEFYIKTGRTHQIRSQSSLHKHPLLGDTAYGGKKIEFGNQDFYLQAKELIFPENDLNIPEKIEINKSENLLNFIKHCDNNKIGL